jgi:hypothetical protein
MSVGISSPRIKADAPLRLLWPPEPVPQVIEYAVGITGRLVIRVWSAQAMPHDPPPGSVLCQGIGLIHVEIQPVADPPS